MTILKSWEFCRRDCLIECEIQHFIPKNICVKGRSHSQAQCTYCDQERKIEKYRRSPCRSPCQSLGMPMLTCPGKWVRSKFIQPLLFSMCVPHLAVVLSAVLPLSRGGWGPLEPLLSLSCTIKHYLKQLLFAYVARTCQVILYEGGNLSNVQIMFDTLLVRCCLP